MGERRLLGPQQLHWSSGARLVGRKRSLAPQAKAMLGVIGHYRLRDLVGFLGCYSDLTGFRGVGSVEAKLFEKELRCVRNRVEHGDHPVVPECLQDDLLIIAVESPKRTAVPESPWPQAVISRK